MSIFKRKVLLQIALVVGSFLFMLLFAGLTSPLNKIAYAIVFFAALLVFLVSLGHLVVRLQNGRVDASSRYYIWIVSLLILVAVMLRSAQSFNLIDVMVIGLIAFGLLFYSNRRG
jgi:hypothetical protein